MEKSWKRIIPMEDQSDSSSSDESQYLYNGNFWKRSVMSSRMKIPRLDGQGPSSQPGFSAVLVSAHPNPSDVLMHHDYVGSSRNNPNVNSTTLESSTSFRNMESYFTKLRDLYRSRNTTVFNAHAPSTSNPLWFDNDTDPNREHDSSQELAVAVLAEMQLSAASHPTIIENRFNEENQETVQDISQLEHNDRNRMFCPTTPPLPPTEHPEAVPRESVLISPVKTEEQTPSSPLENVASTSNNVEVQNMPPKNTRITCVINKSEDTIQKQDGGLNEVLLGLLECPVCWEVMPPPIYQCLRGHLLCRPCRKRLSVCPTCRATLSASRNLAMEKVAEKLQYPCKNSGSGCTALVVLQDKREHEANCAHRLFPCLSPFCAPRWTCKLDTLVLHYEAMHSEMLRRGPKHILRIPVNHDFYRKVTSHVWVILAFEKLFTINLRIVPPGEVFGCVQYVGPYRMSRKFIYELKAQLPLEIYRCAKFERTTHSDQSNIDRLYLKKDCFHLSDNWTKNFKSDNSSRSMEYLEISATIRAS